MRKAQAHARTGEALEQLHQKELEEHAPELAYHFAEAGAVGGTGKMVRYSLIAGERALANFANQEALAYFQQALTMKAEQLSDADTAALLFGLGRAQAATMERQYIQEVVATLSRAFDYYVAAGNSDQAVAIAEYPFYPPIGQRSGNAQLIARALALVPAQSSAAGRLLSRYGRVMGIEEGDFKGAQEAFTQALFVAQSEGEPALEMRTLADAGNVENCSNVPCLVMRRPRPPSLTSFNDLLLGIRTWPILISSIIRSRAPKFLRAGGVESGTRT